MARVLLREATDQVDIPALREARSICIRCIINVEDPVGADRAGGGASLPASSASLVAFPLLALQTGGPLLKIHQCEQQAQPFLHDGVAHVNGHGAARRFIILDLVISLSIGLGSDHAPSEPPLACLHPGVPTAPLRGFDQRTARGSFSLVAIVICHFSTARADMHPRAPWPPHGWAGIRHAFCFTHLDTGHWAACQAAAVEGRTF